MPIFNANKIMEFDLLIKMGKVFSFDKSHSTEAKIMK